MRSQEQQEQRSLRRQRGAGMIGIIFILIGLSIIGMLGVKLAPMFVDNMTIEEVIRQMATDPQTKTMSNRDLRAALSKRLLVNGLDKYAKLAQFESDEGVVYLTLNYERRDNLWANVDIVGVFENSAELRTE